MKVNVKLHWYIQTLDQFIISESENPRNQIMVKKDKNETSVDPVPYYDITMNILYAIVSEPYYLFHFLTFFAYFSIRITTSNPQYLLHRVSHIFSLFLNHTRYWSLNFPLISGTSSACCFCHVGCCQGTVYCFNCQYILMLILVLVIIWIQLQCASFD